MSFVPKLTKVFSKGLIDIQPFISSEHMKKSPIKIEQMRKPIQIIERVLAEGIKKVETGMRKFGPDGPSFTTIGIFQTLMRCESRIVFMLMKKEMLVLNSFPNYFQIL